MHHPLVTRRLHVLNCHCSIVLCSRLLCAANAINKVTVKHFIAVRCRRRTMIGLWLAWGCMHSIRCPLPLQLLIINSTWTRLVAHVGQLLHLLECHIVTPDLTWPDLFTCSVHVGLYRSAQVRRNTTCVQLACLYSISVYFVSSKVYRMFIIIQTVSIAFCAMTTLRPIC